MRPDLEQQLARSARRLSLGSVGGRSESAMRLPERPRGQPYLPTQRGATRGVTVTIAAADSSAEERDAADYVCDGVADEVEIQAAVDFVGALGGGVPQLLEGQFVTSAGATIDILEGVWLRGLGAATNLTHAIGGDLTITMGNGSTVEFVRLSDLFLNGDIVLGTINTGRIHDCEINGAIYGAADLDLLWFWINDNAINGFSPDGYSIDLASGGLNYVSIQSNNVFSMKLQGGDHAFAHGEHNAVVNNRGMNGDSIVDWMLYFTWTANNGWGALDFTNISEATSTGGTHGRIIGDNCFLFTWTGMHVESSHDLVFTNCDDCLFGVNTVIGYVNDGSDDATIELVGCTRMAVKSNMIRDNNGLIRPDYAVEVDAACVGCCVTDNDAEDAYAIAVVNDLGTGTQTVSGNR